MGLAWLIELRKCLAKEMNEATTAIMCEGLLVMLDGQVLWLSVGAGQQSVRSPVGWLGWTGAILLNISCGVFEFQTKQKEN